MFCAGCGSQIQSGLSYCSRCGRRASEETGTGKVTWTNPLTIVGQTAGVGFVGFIFVLLILTRSGALPNLYLPITFFYFAALFGICFMILRYGAAATKAETPRVVEDFPTAAYLRPVTTAQLEEARDMGIGSVTDATTRTLDEMKIERK